jgi:hypothetical protein
MKIFICTSKHLYSKIPPIKKALEDKGHVITLPNSYDAPFMEEDMKKISREQHIAWKSEMLRKQIQKVKDNDAILVLNFEKNGQPNYIGGATFLEIFSAFEYNKKIFLINPIPDGIFKDELIAINPIILNGNVNRIN